MRKFLFYNPPSLSLSLVLSIPISCLFSMTFSNKSAVFQGSEWKDPDAIVSPRIVSRAAAAAAVVKAKWAYVARQGITRLSDAVATTAYYSYLHRCLCPAQLARLRGTWRRRARYLHDLTRNQQLVVCDKMKVGTPPLVLAPQLRGRPDRHTYSVLKWK